MKNKYLIISIDTEVDWFDKATNRLENLKCLDTLTSLFDRYGMKPTYLVTYEVTQNERAVKKLKGLQDSGRCEIGSHLHVWSTPPFKNQNNFGVDEEMIEGIQSELDDNVFYAKIETLHETIGNSFGRYPTSHRAGRWGIDERTIEWLSRNNYLVDSSICPLTDWTKEKGISKNIRVNSMEAPNHPYRPSMTDITKKGGENNAFDLLEIPVTAIPANPIFGNYSTKTSKKVNSLFKGLGFRVHKNILFRPSHRMPSVTFRKISEHLFGGNGTFFNMMFHSNETHSGTSPYSKNMRRYSSLMKRLEASLKAAAAAGLKGVTLSEAATIFNEQENLRDNK
ncbi:MAG: hypothetical protein ABIJ24_02395 [Nitrospinota bacterium]|nr:hypothetical protein [Nitrospinota bacterium]